MSRNYQQKRMSGTQCLRADMSRNYQQKRMSGTQCLRADMSRNYQQKRMSGTQCLRGLLFHRKNIGCNKNNIKVMNDLAHEIVARWIWNCAMCQSVLSYSVLFYSIPFHSIVFYLIQSNSIFFLPDSHHLSWSSR